MRISTTLRQLAALFVALVALAASSAAWAQTTGQLRGTVFDEDGFGVPNAAVVLEGRSLIGGQQSRATNIEGAFQFVELPPGPYTMTISKDGFDKVAVTGIVVNLNRTTVQNVTVKLASDSGETIVVEGVRQVVEVEDVSRGQVLTKEFLQRIPTGRSYQSAVQQVAGVVGGGGNPNMGGSAYNENTYMLDGINITDPVTGTFSLNFNFDAIQQIEVVLGGYMPEQGISLGGIVNVVTDQGTNNLEFDSSIFYTNGNWRPKMDARYTADGYDLAPTGFDSTYELLQVSGKVSGPVIRDRAWFMISYQHSRSLIANVGIAQPRDYEGHYVLGKLTVQPNAEHRITALLQVDPTSIDNTDQGDPFQKPEAQPRQYQGGFVASGRWQWFLSSNVNLDTSITTQKSFIEAGSTPCTHDRTRGLNPCKPGEQEGEVDWDTAGRLGLFGAYDSVNYTSFDIDDRFRYNASSKLSLVGIEDPLGGTHDFKFGVEANQNVWDRIVGYYGNTQYVDLNEVTYDPRSFKNYYWLEITGPIKFRTTSSQWNFFVQDAWKPMSNLVIKGGVRFDHTVMRNDLAEAVVVGNLLGPRLYASWDPFGDQRTKIAGGYGRFNDTSRLGVAGFTSAGSFGSKLFLGEFFSSGSQGYLNSADLMYSLGDRDNRAIANENLRLPRADEINLIVQREIMQDVGIGTDISYKMTRYLYEPDERNVIYDEDGSTVIGSRFGDPFQNFYRLRTPAEAKRDYIQWNLALYKVESRRWLGQVTYTYTQSVGNSRNALSGSFANDPQSQYNYGRLYETDLRHVVKGVFSWRLPTDPWNQTIGGFFQYYSGNPIERFYWANLGAYSLRIRPRGVYAQLPSWWTMSIKFTQELDVRKGKLVLDAEVRNLLNNRAPDSLNWTQFYRENRMFTYRRQDPLRVQLGLRYQF